MKKQLFLSAAVTALAAFGGSAALAADISRPIAAPAVVAPSQVSGYVEGYVGFGGTAYSGNYYYDYGATSWYDYDYGQDFSILGGAGRFAYAFNPALTVQLDAWYESRSWGNWGDIDPVLGFGAHLIRNSGNFAYGALVSVGDNEDWDARLYNLAAEGAWFGGASSIRVQGGYTGVLDGYYDYSAFYGVASVSYFVTPNLQLSANVGIASISNGEPGYDWDASATQVSWGGRVDYKFGRSPFSVFAAYRGSSLEGNEDWDGGYYTGNWTTVQHTGLIGVRLNFGGDTLQALDRSVGFKDNNPLFGYSGSY